MKKCHRRTPAALVIADETVCWNKAQFKKAKREAARKLALFGARYACGPQSFQTIILNPK